MCHIFIKIIFRSINVKKIIKSRDFFIIYIAFNKSNKADQ